MQFICERIYNITVYVFAFIGLFFVMDHVEIPSSTPVYPPAWKHQQDLEESEQLINHPIDVFPLPPTTEEDRWT